MKTGDSHPLPVAADGRRRNLRTIPGNPPPHVGGYAGRGAHAPSGVAGCALASSLGSHTTVVVRSHDCASPGFSARARKTAPEGGCAPRRGAAFTLLQRGRSVRVRTRCDVRTLKRREGRAPGSIRSRRREEAEPTHALGNPPPHVGGYVRSAAFMPQRRPQGTGTVEYSTPLSLPTFLRPEGRAPGRARLSPARRQTVRTPRRRGEDTVPYQTAPARSAVTGGTRHPISARNFASTQSR